MKGYRFHVFVSYSRTPSATRWVRKLFVPTLRDYLHDQLGKKADVFDDQRLQDGGDFDEQLYQNLGDSAILVPVLTAAYFESEWCRREFACMREREATLGWRTPANPLALIVPVYLSGRARFPAIVQKMQCTDFWEFNNPDLAEGTSRRAEFNDFVRNWSAGIVAAFHAANRHDQQFRDLRGAAFLPDLEAPNDPVPVPSMFAYSSAA